MLGADRGAGSVLALAVASAVLVVAGIVLPLSASLVVRRAAAGAADAAALAAADVAVGIYPGYPCETAARVAASNGAALDSCELDGPVVTVQVSRSVAGFAVVARATAGPPPNHSIRRERGESVYGVAGEAAVCPPIAI